MKFLLAILALIFTSIFAVNVPFEACDGVSSVFKVVSIDGTNWPPIKEKNFSTRTTYNTNGGSITSGTQFTVLSKWNGVTVDNSKGDGCTFGDVKCPLSGSTISITNEGVLPGNAPSGSYVVKTYIKDAQENYLFCYQTKFQLD